MQRKFTGFSFYALALLFIISSCTKIDTTTIGGDLIPVDNETTFADTLDIIGTQGTFTDDITTTNRSTTHVLGAITNDPVFGKTNAELFLELKPGFFPYYFGAAGDTIDPVFDNRTRFDSAVLCLSYKYFYGDTNQLQSFKVYAINNSTTDFKDTSYRLNYRPDGGLGTLIGSATINPKRLADTIHFPGSAAATVNNQLRIKLDNDFLNSFIGKWTKADTAAGSTSIYRSDTNFRAAFKGFAIVHDDNTAGSGLFYVSLTDNTTRLEVHYVKRNKAVIDTSFSSFYLTNGNTNVVNSAHANFVQRDSTGSELKDNRQGDALYIQTTPGTYANLSIPGLANRKNAIIHRAEIFVEQIPSLDPPTAAIDDYLIPPAYLYLDLIDSANKGFKPIYLDLNPSSIYDPDNSITYFPAAGIDYNYFGGYQHYADSNGKKVYYFTFNITRYVQRMATNGEYNYNFRLYAPVDLYYRGYKTSFTNSLAYGRIKIGNGINRGKMRLRIVYSKI